MVKISKRKNNLFLNKEDEVIEKIKQEVEKKNLFGAFLLSHGYMEAYLFELILYSGSRLTKMVDFNENVIKNLERINFNNLLHINLILGNLNFGLYKRILKFNEVRNKIVHEIIVIDLSKQEKMMKKQIKSAIYIIKNLSKIYKKKIEIRSKIIEEGAKI